MVQLGRARTLFFSAEPTARVVGATADLLLEGDEAQDIAEDTGTKDFTPMAASTNATTVLYGTAWTSDTLLARTIQHLQQQQTRDGIRRVFQYDAAQVAEHVPAYGRCVQQQVARLGRDHPLIKTQYKSSPSTPPAAYSRPPGACPERRRKDALMRGDHVRRNEPAPGRHEPEHALSGAEGPDYRYALHIDVAGEEEVEGTALERMMLENPNAVRKTALRPSPP